MEKGYRRAIAAGLAGRRGRPGETADRRGNPVNRPRTGLCAGTVHRVTVSAFGGLGTIARYTKNNPV